MNTPRVIALLGGGRLTNEALARAVSARLNARGLDTRSFVDDPWQVFLRQHERAPDWVELEGLLQSHASAIEQASQDRDVLIVAQALLPLVLCLDGDVQTNRDWREKALTQLRLAKVNVLMPGEGEGSFRGACNESAIRQVLQSARLPYTAVKGSAPMQIDQAMMAIEHVLDTPQRLARAAARPRWRWLCERCDDGSCEHASKA